MPQEYQYILIDDSEFDLFLNKEFLTLAGVSEDIISFDSAANALQFIIKESENLKPTVILLDIHMPVMDGFEFLEKFDLFPDHIKKKLRIFMVSSTLDIRDIQNAKDNKNVVDILPKPLNTATLKTKLGL